MRWPWSRRRPIAEEMPTGKKLREEYEQFLGQQREIAKELLPPPTPAPALWPDTEPPLDVQRAMGERARVQGRRAQRKFDRDTHFVMKPERLLELAIRQAERRERQADQDVRRLKVLWMALTGNVWR